MVVPDPVLALMAMLMPVGRGWQRVLDRAVAEAGAGAGVGAGAIGAPGVSGSAGWCLLHLARMDRAPSQAELAHVLDVAPPSIVRTIDTLAAAGLVKRLADAGDKRSNRVAITPEGRAFATRIEARLGEALAEIVKDVPEPAIDIMVEVLDLIGQRMNAQGEE